MKITSLLLLITKIKVQVSKNLYIKYKTIILGNGWMNQTEMIIVNRLMKAKFLESIDSGLEVTCLKLRGHLQSKILSCMKTSTINISTKLKPKKTQELV